MRVFAASMVFCLSLQSVAAWAEPVAENVVLISTDGLRWQELFTGAEERLINKPIGRVEDPRAMREKFMADSPEARRERLMPFFWEFIARKGQILGDPASGSHVVCTNEQYFSYPGYNEMLCGFADPEIDSNDPIPNRNVSVLEWLNRRPEFAGRVAVIASWERFPEILNVQRSGLYVNAGWMPLDGWSESPEVDAQQLNQLARELPHYWESLRWDAFTFRGALAYLKAKKPRVMYLSLGETDDWCHAGRYDLYLQSARHVDDYIRTLWTTLEAMPEYAGKTAIVLTTDHGRGTGPLGWKSHGKNNPGSHEMWIAAFGAGVAAKGVRKKVKATQAQVAATVANLLGLDFTSHDERIAAPLKLGRTRDVPQGQAACQPCGVLGPALERERFDAAPEWEGFRNRLVPVARRVVHQDFGYRKSNLAGGRQAGEIGGTVHRAHERASYAKVIPVKSFHDRLEASGRFSVTHAGGSSGALIGWFHHESSQGWRTPDSLAFRIDGNGRKFWVFFEYGTSQWGTGGSGAFEGERYQTTITPPFPADGTSHTWSLVYDPDANNSLGLIRLRIDDRQYECPLHPGHKETHGAVLNRFGIWNQQIAGDELEVYLDDVTIDGEKFSFDTDPGWHREGNPAAYKQRVIRPYHNFGFVPSDRAGGEPGEIGGIVFRDEQPMFYGDQVGPLSLDDELKASGRIVLASAGADSAVTLGWFNSKAKREKTTPEHEEPQTDYLGIQIDGPSRIGHYFRAGYSTARGTHDAPTHEGTPNERPVIRPDGKGHSWSLHYDPQAAGGRGQIAVTFDGVTTRLELQKAARAEGATLDRFGVFNTQSGGHHVELYVDDISYTR